MSDPHTKCVRYAVVVVATAMLACGGDDNNNNARPDSGTTNDAGLDAPVGDSGLHDGTVSDAPAADGAMEASSDGGTSSDAATDSGNRDAGSDAGSSDARADGPADAGVAFDSGLAVLPGYTVSLFATGGTQYTQPDSIEFDGTSHIWVGYQMGVLTTDGTDAGPPYYSKVVQYNLDGTLTGKEFDVPGHCDGVRVDPDTGLVWATSNEDGNAVLMSFDPKADASTATTMYPVGALPHGGGLDDLAFVNHQMFVVDSAPVAMIDANVYSGPAISQVTISGSTATFTPIVYDNSTALIGLAGDAGSMTLNVQDPDSLTTYGNGNLLLVDQQGSELLFITNPGAGLDGGVDGGTQTVSVVQMAPALSLDDTVFASTATGRLLVADGVTDTIYWVSSAFTPGTLYTETPHDSSVPGTVAVVNLDTGAIQPVLSGMKNPTGMIFVK